MARALLLDRTELAPGETSFARFRLESPLVARPGDRFVVRSYSPIVTIGGGTLLDVDPPRIVDRKSTRLNSSHGYISYAVFCLKKKNTRFKLPFLDFFDIY